MVCEWMLVTAFLESWLNKITVEEGWALVCNPHGR